MSNFTRRTLLIGGAAATGTLGVAGIALAPAILRAQEPELTVEDVLFDPANPVMGNPEGDVTIVEYFDYQCPYCKANHPVLTEVVKEDGNIRLVMKDWPIFGAPSITAAQLALGAATLGRYEQANEVLMETEGKLSDELIHDTLEIAGFEISELEKAYAASREKWDGLLARNSRQAAILGLRGTPAFIIGKSLFPGAMDGDALRSAVKAARA